MKSEGKSRQPKPSPGPEPLRLKIEESELGAALPRILGAGKPKTGKGGRIKVSRKRER